MAYQYRVNFGNGQVHDVGSKKEAFRFISGYCDGSAFVEWQDPETRDWFQLSGNGARR